MLSFRRYTTPSCLLGARPLAVPGLSEDTSEWTSVGIFGGGDALPGCSCRALLFEVSIAEVDTLRAYTGKYPIPPATSEPRHHGALNHRESEKPTGKHRENVGGEHRGA